MPVSKLERDIVRLKSIQETFFKKNKSLLDNLWEKGRNLEERLKELEASRGDSQEDADLLMKLYEERGKVFNEYYSIVSEHGDKWTEELRKFIQKYRII